MSVPLVRQPGYRNHERRDCSRNAAIVHTTLKYQEEEIDERVARLYGLYVEEAQPAQALDVPIEEVTGTQ